MAASGFNKLNHDCDKGGPGQNCFNKKRRPKIEMFASCFRGAVNFGDVDGLVELGGKFCMLEWKGDGGKVSTGQRMSYEAFTRIPGNIVFVVSGDAESMKVKSFSMFWRGRHCNSIKADLEATKQRISDWANWAERKEDEDEEVNA